MRTLVKILSAGMLCLLFTACGSTNKTMVPLNKDLALDELVASRQFTITMDWARPMMTTSMTSVMLSGLRPPGSAVSRINLMGNGNYLALEGDQVRADLPYYGERQSGGGYNSNAGIKFDGLANDLEFSKHEKKDQHDIQFTISEQAETYRVRITLTPNRFATILIASSQRNTIWYEGKVSSIPDAELE